MQLSLNKTLKVDIASKRSFCKNVFYFFKIKKQAAWSSTACYYCIIGEINEQ